MLCTAVEIAAAVRQGHVPAADVVERYLARIAALDPDIGAFRTVLAERARAEAAALDRCDDRRDLPLAGVPVAIKDNTAVAGAVSRSGSAATPDAPAAADHEVVRRLRAAGAVVVGITSMPELGLYPLDDSVYGSTRNPWAPGRTAGGSSAGAAAAVAAGMVPLAQGNDALGSIRVPAAACGVVGLKPGPGLVPPPFETAGDPWFGLAVNGPLATTVRDVALVLSVMAGRGDLAVPAPPTRRLRVALSTRSPVAGLPLDREFADAARRTAAALTEAGHDVREVDPPYPLTLGTTVLAAWCACAENSTRGLDRERLTAPTRRLSSAGALARRLGLVRTDAWQRWRRQVEEFFDRADVLVCPALAQAPPTAAGWSRRGLLRSVLAASRFSPFAAPWNLAGAAAAVVPAGVHRSGAPLAVQLVARAGRESTLLSVALELEDRRPWRRLAPAYEPVTDPGAVPCRAVSSRAPRCSDGGCS